MLPYQISIRIVTRSLYCTFIIPVFNKAVPVYRNNWILRLDIYSLQQNIVNGFI